MDKTKKAITIEEKKLYQALCKVKFQPSKDILKINR